MTEADGGTASEAAAAAWGLFGPHTQVIDGIEYAWNDFVPVGVSTSHKVRCLEAHHQLLEEFRSRPGDALVAGNLNVYYDLRRPRLAVDPDIMVVVGVADRNRERYRYRVWEEGRPPSFVLEVLSPATWRADLVVKMTTYARMGVREYFLLDDDGTLMPPPPLQGFRLSEQAGSAPSYKPVPPWSAAKCASRRAKLGYRCETLDLGIALPLGVRGLRFHAPATGGYLATPAEEHAEIIRLRTRVRQAETRAAALERLLAGD